MARRTGKTEAVEQWVLGYPREQSMIETSFTCGLCGCDVTELRYPGHPPTVCAQCMGSFKSPGAARQALWKKNNPEAYAAKLKQQRQRRQDARKVRKG